MKIDLLSERLNRGLTLDAAAEAMGVDKSVLWRTEQGQTRPSARNAFAIASFYDLKVTDIWPVPEREAA